jgi:hypothetical protein
VVLDNFKEQINATIPAFQALRRGDLQYAQRILGERSVGLDAAAEFQESTYKYAQAGAMVVSTVGLMVAAPLIATGATSLAASLEAAGASGTLGGRLAAGIGNYAATVGKNMADLKTLVGAVRYQAQMGTFMGGIGTVEQLAFGELGRGKGFGEALWDIGSNFVEGAVHGYSTGWMFGLAVPTTALAGFAGRGVGGKIYEGLARFVAAPMNLLSAIPRIGGLLHTAAMLQVYAGATHVVERAATNMLVAAGMRKDHAAEWGPAVRWPSTSVATRRPRVS